MNEPDDTLDRTATSVWKRIRMAVAEAIRLYAPWSVIWPGEYQESLGSYRFFFSFYLLWVVCLVVIVIIVLASLGNLLGLKEIIPYQSFGT